MGCENKPGAEMPVAGIVCGAFMFLVAPLKTEEAMGAEVGSLTAVVTALGAALGVEAAPITRLVVAKPLRVSAVWMGCEEGSVKWPMLVCVRR